MVEKLANLEDYQITILKETAENELKRKSILLSTANHLQDTRLWLHLQKV